MGMEITTINDGAELPEHVRRNRAHWDARAADYEGPGESAWARNEPTWGIWRVPESKLRVLPEDLAGKDVIELGCGTAYVSAWLARRGARVVGIDNSGAQLATARRLQGEHGLDFTLIHGNAEQVPYPDASFDLAISEYGACLWADPYRSRPGGGPYPASWRRAYLSHELSSPHALRAGGRRRGRERPAATAGVWDVSDRVAGRCRRRVPSVPRRLAQVAPA
jgi:SAM-dependent methyltransferase